MSIPAILIGLGNAAPAPFVLQGRTLKAFGDSIMFGINTSPGNDFISLVADNWNMPLTNYAVSGTTMENQSPVNSLASPNMEQRAATDIPTYTAGVDGLLAIGYLTNDVGLNFPDYNTTNYAAAISYVIDVATGKGWPKSRIFFTGRYFVTDYGLTNGYGAPTPADLARYDDFYNTLLATCTTEGVTVFDFWNELSAVPSPVSHLDSYERHPDDYMHNIIATKIIAHYS